MAKKKTKKIAKKKPKKTKTKATKKKGAKTKKKAAKKTKKKATKKKAAKKKPGKKKVAKKKKKAAAKKPKKKAKKKTKALSKRAAAKAAAQAKAAAKAARIEAAQAKLKDFKGFSINSMVKRQKDVAWRMIDGEAVIITPVDSTMHSLNDVGTRIWELLTGDRSLKEVAVMLLAEFDVDKDRAEKDTLWFAECLAKKGLVDTG